MKSFRQYLVEFIEKHGNRYDIMSKKGKPLGSYDSKKKAVKRLRQIEWFKRH
jgi:hypothetical protein